MTKDYLAMIREEPGDAKQYGVKGMHWGIRKDPETLAKKRQALGEKARSKADAAADPKKKSEYTEKAASLGVHAPAGHEVVHLKKHDDGTATLSDTASEGSTKVFRNKASGEIHTIASDGSRGDRIGSDGITESSTTRYNRLLAQSKTHGGNSLTTEELQFVNQRGDAIRRLNQLTAEKPNWLHDAVQQATKDTAKQAVKKGVRHGAKKLAVGAVLL